MVCYWKKPALSAVGTSLKLLKVKDLKEIRDLSVPDGSFLGSVVDHNLELGPTNTELTKYYKTFSDIEKMSVHDLIITFLKNARSDEDVTANSFFKFCKLNINIVASGVGNQVTSRVSFMARIKIFSSNCF